MRSLRDFNIPKIVTDDVPVFMGLIGDLFPALDVPRKRDLGFEAVVKEAVLELRLQPEDNFVLKVRPRDILLYLHHYISILFPFFPNSLPMNHMGGENDLSDQVDTDPSP